MLLQCQHVHQQLPSSPLCLSAKHLRECRKALFNYKTNSLCKAWADMMSRMRA